MESTSLKRTVKRIKTSLGEAQIKVCELVSGKRVYPEYASVVELCEKHRMAYQDVYYTIKKECEAAAGIRDRERVELNHHARECIECGECMKNCPFGVEIIKKMKQAVGVFGE